MVLEPVRAMAPTLAPPGELCGMRPVSVGTKGAVRQGTPRHQRSSPHRLAVLHRTTDHRLVYRICAQKGPE